MNPSSHMRMYVFQPVESHRSINNQHVNWSIHMWTDQSTCGLINSHVDWSIHTIIDQFTRELTNPHVKWSSTCGMIKPHVNWSLHIWADQCTHESLESHENPSAVHTFRHRRQAQRHRHNAAFIRPRRHRGPQIWPSTPRLTDRVVGTWAAPMPPRPNIRASVCRRCLGIRCVGKAEQVGFGIRYPFENFGHRFVVR